MLFCHSHLLRGLRYFIFDSVLLWDDGPAHPTDGVVQEDSLSILLATGPAHGGRCICVILPAYAYAHACACPVSAYVYAPSPSHDANINYVVGLCVHAHAHLCLFQTLALSVACSVSRFSHTPAYALASSLSHHVDTHHMSVFLQVPLRTQSHTHVRASAHTNTHRICARVISFHVYHCLTHAHTLMNVRGSPGTFATK